MSTINIRVKMKCVEVSKTMGGVYDENGKYVPGLLYSYKFHVVTGDSEENKKFFASTPSGSLSFSALRDDYFEVGKEYYFDSSPAENL